MFRSALAAALRHLYRGKLYAAIAVSGLAVALCVALLAALYIRSQYSLEHFVPGYRNVYLATTTSTYPDRPPNHSTYTPYRLAALMKHSLPGIASVTRVGAESVLLRRGDVELTSIGGVQLLASVDPNFFVTFPLKVLAGDPVTALADPDKLVMTRDMARRFFGEEPPLGKTLEVVLMDGSIEAVTLGSKHAVTVGAVIDDIPPDRSRLFPGGVFVSGRSAWTRLGFYGDPSEGFPVDDSGERVLTLVRLHPGASPQSVREGLPELLAQLPRFVPLGAPEEALVQERPDLLRIDRVHTNADYNPGVTGRILVAMTLALVILGIGAVNFVNLLTARSGARCLEVGVRKLSGASRAALAWQFLGETFVYVAVAVVAAVAMTELFLPHFNAFLGVKAVFNYWDNPALLGWILLGAGMFGLLAGFWPALVLSALRPLGAMHGGRVARGSGGVPRQVLVSLQFALLVGLILTAGVMYLQRQYAMEQALSFDTDQVLVLEMRCTPARTAELRRLAGVRDAACSSSRLLGGGEEGFDAKTRDGQTIRYGPVPIDDRMLGLYGVEPLAGRGLTAADFDPAWRRRHSTRYLINESAMRALGFESPVAALGAFPLTLDRLRARGPEFGGLEEIIGVVPDFSMEPVDSRTGPQLFYADPTGFSTISVKLAGTDIPATLAAIDGIWKNTGGARDGFKRERPLNRYFYDERVQRMYQSMLREARTFGIAALLAIALALLGLLGLAALAADQRTKEIGLRKALGATTGDVLRLLLWQFSKPVLWANLIAWPVAGYLMQRWLSGYAYRIDLPLWLFPAVALVVLLVALATVTVQALALARSRPVLALRHE